MAEPAVVNASPLIFLAGAGLAELLQLAGTPVQLPKAVVEEIERYGPADPTATAVKQLNWLAIVDSGPAPAVIERWDLGSGETSVLTWAYAHPGTTAVLDDLAARRCASSFGIPVRGTLGLILTAKRRGVIAQARPVVEQLRSAGMYLSDPVMNRALKMVGEMTGMVSTREEVYRYLVECVRRQRPDLEIGLCLEDATKFAALDQ